MDNIHISHSTNLTNLGLVIAIRANHLWVVSTIKRQNIAKISQKRRLLYVEFLNTTSYMEFSTT